jgi:lambda family phage portal protein
MFGLSSLTNLLRRKASSAFEPGQTGPAYDAAGAGRRTSTWRPTAAAVNTILFASADALRSRSRDIVRKNAWAQQGVQRYASNAIGTGIKPQSLHPDKNVRKAIQKLWTRWTDDADAHGVTDFYGQQRTVAVALKEAGEVFARLRPRLESDGLSVPLQVQLIEAEHVPLNLNMPGQNGNIVRAGIEFDPLGRRVAYHMYREHPGDISLVNNPNQIVRVPAADVIHVFEPLRPGQIRGVPGMATVLLKIFEFDQYEDGELVRNRDAAQFSGFIKDDPQALAALADGGAADKILPTIPGVDPATGSSIELTALEPGTFQKLREAEDVVFAKPAGQAEGYDSFMKWVLRAIAAGLGIPYETLTGDLSGVNYSSIRAGMLEFRRAVEQFQHSVFVFQFCRPIWARWMDTAVFSGALPMSARDYRVNRGDWVDVKWIPQGFGWVDPAKEVAAAKDAIRSGLSSRTQEVAARGYDSEDIDAEQAVDNARADDLGVVYDSDGRRAASGSPATPAADEQQQDQADTEKSAGQGKAA